MNASETVVYKALRQWALVGSSPEERALAAEFAEEVCKGELRLVVVVR